MFSAYNYSDVCDIYHRPREIAFLRNLIVVVLLLYYTIYDTTARPKIIYANRTREVVNYIAIRTQLHNSDAPAAAAVVESSDDYYHNIKVCGTCELISHNTINYIQYAHSARVLCNLTYGTVIIMSLQ